MTDKDTPPFLRLPTELRLDIYKYLLQSHEERTLAIRNRAPGADCGRRTRYFRAPLTVLEKALPGKLLETTYHLDNSNIKIHTAIMSVNRQIYHETAGLVYGDHAFDFGRDIEVVAPFLEDRTPVTRKLIKEVSVHVRPMSPLGEGWKYDWRRACALLSQAGGLRRLRLVVEGGRPSSAWDGPRTLEPSDLRLLWGVRHGLVDWVGGLAQLAEAGAAVAVEGDTRYAPLPQTPNAKLYTAFSTCITTSFVEFLRTDLKVDASAGKDGLCPCFHGWCGCHGGTCGPALTQWS